MQPNTNSPALTLEVVFVQPTANVSASIYVAPRPFFFQGGPGRPRVANRLDTPVLRHLATTWLLASPGVKAAANEDPA